VSDTATRFAPPRSHRDDERPRLAQSAIRYQMLGMATMVAIMLYVDRLCLSNASNAIEKDLNLRGDQNAWLQSAFFWAYALLQLPAGWLGDRYGPRRVLTFYLVLWSVCTGLMGAAVGFWSLFVLRLGCGVFEAGAYPICASIAKRWASAEQRGIASAMIAVGGRIGGVIAPIATAGLMALGAWLLVSLGATTGDARWRLPFIIYGIIGVALALIFYRKFRDWPRAHPDVSEQELRAIEGDDGYEVASTRESIGSSDREANPSQDAQQRSSTHHGGPPMIAMLKSTSLWCNAFMQFGTNFGWVFVATMLPKYLEETFQTPEKERAFMQSAALFAGMIGMLCGGFLTDLGRRSFGLRWGRIVPIFVTRLVMASGFVIAIYLKSPWLIILSISLMSWAADAGTAAVWSYAQDVGGKHTGAVLGWTNMWGNFGAAIGPIAYGWIAAAFANKEEGWHAVFYACSAMVFLAALATLGIHADKKIEPTTST
jgi:MFS family permease